jgi:hypothetical protein
MYIGGSDIIIFDIETPLKIEDSRIKWEENLLIELLNKKEYKSDSTISSILLKPLLEYCIPIIDDIPKVKITIYDTEKRANIKVQSKTEIEKGISIIFDKDIVCFFNNEYIKITSGQMVTVIGLILPNNIISLNKLDIFDYLSSNNKYPINTILKTGFYTTYNIYKNYFSIPFLSNPLENNERKVMFTNKTEDNNEKINNLINFCMGINHLYNTIIYLSTKSITLENMYYTYLDKRFGIFKSYEETLIEWLIKNKITDKNKVKYVNMNIDFYILIEKIEWYNGPNQKTKSFEEQIKFLINNEEINHIEKIEKIKSNIEVAYKRIISYNKFGISNLFKLTKSQKNDVYKIYEKEKVELKETNISPLIAELNIAIDKNIIDEKLLNSVLELLDKDGKNKFEKILKESTIKTASLLKLEKNAGEICPHILEYATNLKDNVNVETIENNILNKYGAQESNIFINRDRNTYCKICGSLLSEYDEEDIAYKELDKYMISIEDDEMFSIIKQELQYVLSYYMFQPKTLSISIFTIVDLLSSIIRSKLLEIQADLIKIKTLSDNEMWILININIYIYIFAILTQFVFANPEILQFKDNISPQHKKYNKSEKSGGKDITITKSSKQIVEQLLKQKHGKENLEKLINNSLELVKKIKYSDILNSKYITISNIRELFLNAYKWVLTLNYNIENIEDITGNKSTTFKQSDIEQYNIIKFLSKYGKLGRTYEKIEAENEPLYKTAELNKENDEEVILLYKYITEEQFMIKPIPITPEHTKIIDNFITLKNKDNKEYITYKKSRFRPLLSIPHIHLKQAYKLDLPYEIVSNCGKNCSKTYMYQGTKKTDLYEYTQKDIVGWLESNNKTKLNELYSLNCLGMKCVCKEKKNNKILLFYKYFEQFCPKGELHEYTEKKCSKCGITSEIINQKDNDYFNKYKDVFIKIKKKENKIISDELIMDKIKKEENEKEKYPEWKITTKEIKELAKIINIKNIVNLFLNIGIFEGNAYKLIEDNKIQPYIDASDSIYICQSNITHNYILYMYRNYYVLKNSEYIIKIPQELKHLLTKASQSNKDFSKKLDDLDMNYINKYDYYINQKIKPVELANFGLTTLANLFLTIHNIFKNAKIEKFGKIWIDYYISKILGFERVLCEIKLRNLKPLQKLELEEGDYINDMEDGDMVHSAVGTEDNNMDNESLMNEYLEQGNEYANDDIDIEIDEDIDNQDNMFVHTEM